MSTLQARLEAASTFLLQSPPGEVNDVFSDVRTLVSDDAALESGILPALREYNTQQLTIAELDGNKVLITDVSTLQSAAEGQEERHLDPASGQSFAFDHMRLAATDAQPHPTDSETEQIRAGLAKLLTAYVSNHYSDGVSAVFALPDPNYPTPADEPEFEPKPEAASASAPPASAEADADTTAILANPETSAVADEAAIPSVESVHLEPEADTTATLAEPEAGAVADEAAVEAAGEGEDEPVAKEEDSPAGETTEAADPGESGEEQVKDATEVPSEPVKKEKKVHPTVSRRFGLYLVGNKYNPANFWTGRWRAVYTVDVAEGSLSGEVQVNIHYYEQGNVQLSTSLPSHTSLSPSPSAESVIGALKKAEEAAQKQLDSANRSLSDDTFRSLRRALPKTRTKMSWDKVSAYRLGSEMGGGKE